MRAFRCVCGAAVYFENDRCLNCNRSLAFDAARLTMRPVEADDRYCASHARLGTCNWLAADGAFCLACALNEVVPDLSAPRRLALFAEVENAKRRLLYGLLALGLPVKSRASHADGLGFRVLADARLDGAPLDAAADAVLTGHAEGCITVNLMEADLCLRERMREAMNEPYRTLLGHFRHESGHYYWHRLVRQGDATRRFRALFGDERAPYKESMEAYYRNGPAADWPRVHIVAYQASHPWEDFAECWAHYLHIVDTLETAAHAALRFGEAALPDPLRADAGVDDLLRDFSRLAPALNDLNRSMGMPDAYPFALPPAARAKLAFVHELIRGARDAANESSLQQARALQGAP